MKCINFLTGKDYKQQNRDFIRNKNRRSNILTKARTQPFCRASYGNLGFFDGTGVFPRYITDKDNVFLYNNRFCLISEVQKC